MNPHEIVACTDCGEQTMACRPVCRLCIADRGLVAPPLQPMIHPDDTAVDGFARVMKFKLAHSREVKGRSGWDDPNQCTTEDLNRMLIEHLIKGDPVDVANFCMMLHHRGAKVEMPVSHRLWAWQWSNPDGVWQVVEGHEGQMLVFPTKQLVEEYVEGIYTPDPERYRIAEVNVMPS